ncbi:hypothetical protein ACSBR2_043007 [Camellia fascicularis]
MPTLMLSNLSWVLGFNLWLGFPMRCCLSSAPPLLLLICRFAKMFLDISLKVVLISGCSCFFFFNSLGLVFVCLVAAKTRGNC